MSSPTGATMLSVSSSVPTLLSVSSSVPSQRGVALSLSCNARRQGNFSGFLLFLSFSTVHSIDLQTHVADLEPVLRIMSRG